MPVPAAKIRSGKASLANRRCQPSSVPRVGLPLRELSGRIVPAPARGAHGRARDLPFRARRRRRGRRGKRDARHASRRARPLRARARRHRSGATAGRGAVRGARDGHRPPCPSARALPRPPFSVPSGRRHPSLRDMGGVTRLLPPFRQPDRAIAASPPPLRRHRDGRLERFDLHGAAARELLAGRCRRRVERTGLPAAGRSRPLRRRRGVRSRRNAATRRGAR